VAYTPYSPFKPERACVPCDPCDPQEGFICCFCVLGIIKKLWQRFSDATFESTVSHILLLLMFVRVKIFMISVLIFSAVPYPTGSWSKNDNSSEFPRG
jgi:hypothetical protein